MARKNSARTELAKIASKAYAAAWERSKSGYLDGMSKDELTRENENVWVAVVDAVLRAVT